MQRNPDIFDVSTSEFESSGTGAHEIKNRLNRSVKPAKPTAPRAIPRESIKEFFLYHPKGHLPDLSFALGGMVGIYIEKAYLNPQFNSQLRSKRVWGTDFYYFKSDAVLMSIHSGVMSLESVKADRVKGFLLICQVSKRKNFKDTLSNGIYSYKLNGQVREERSHRPLLTENQGYALKPIRMDNLETFHAKELLSSSKGFIFPQKRLRKVISKRMKPKRPRRFSELYACKFSKSNDLVIEYTLFNVSDKSDEKENFFSHLLEDFLLVIETSNGQKYQLDFQSLKGKPAVFTLDKLSADQRIDRNFLEKHELKVPEKFKKNLFDDLSWDELRWDQDSLRVRGMVIPRLDSLMFLKKDTLEITDLA